MRAKGNQWQERFYQVTRDLREQLQGNQNAIKTLNNLSDEIRDLSNKRNESKEQRQKRVVLLFNKFTRLLNNTEFFTPPLSDDQKSSFLIPVRNIIRDALGFPRPELHHGSHPVHTSVPVLQDRSNLANRAELNFATAVMDLRSILIVKGIDDREVMIHADKLSNLGKQLPDLQMGDSSEEDRKIKALEFLKAFSDIVKSIPKEIIDSIDIQSIRREVRQVIFESLGVNKQQPGSPQMRK